MSYKIIIFSESLPNHDLLGAYAYSLGLALAEQQHEVKIISTKGPVFARTDRCNTLKILYPFKNWSPLELVKILPLFLEFQPQVIFFIQPHIKKSLINVFHFLPHALPIMNTPTRILSLFDLSDPLSWKKNIGLMNACDFITVLSSPQRELILTQSRRLKPNLRVEILPSYLPYESNPSDSSLATELLPQPYVLVPGPLARHNNPFLLFEILQAILEAHPKLRVVFSGGWDETNVELKRKLLRPLIESGFSCNLLFTGPIGPQRFMRLAKEAQVLFGSTLSATGSLVLEMLHLTERFHRPLVISDPLASQLEMAKTLAPFCIVAPLTPTHQVQALSMALNRQIEIPENSLKRPLENYKLSLDAVANTLNRLL